MTKQLPRLATAAIASLAAAGCALPRTVAPGVMPPVVAGKPVATAKGTVTVPLAMPAAADRTTQYKYSKTYINAVEVRLRDSYGNEQTQWVARNAYLAGSQASGSVNVRFYNVMQGQVVLTVRTSHVPMLSGSGPIKYDGLRDIFFIDNDGDSIFDAGETEARVLDGDKSSFFLTFANDTGGAFQAAVPPTVLPDAMRSDSSATPLGFGVGGATGVVAPSGGATTLTATVSTMAQWGPSVFGITREYTAGDTITLGVADAGNVQTTDLVALSSSNPSGGIVDSLATPYQESSLTFSLANNTVSFKPTKTTSVDTASQPTSWGTWLSRGRAVGEVFGTTQVPKIAIWPAVASSTGSLVVGQKNRIGNSGSSKVQYDLRDAFGNPIAGNITGQNSLSIGSAARDNAGLAVDFTTYSSSYTADASGLFPFILPGRTTGSLDTAGNYTQGSTAATPISTAATYSASNTAWKLVKLEVPYFVWNANPLSFPAGNHTYTLGVTADPTNSSNFWVRLDKGGVTVASASIAGGSTGDFLLGPPTPATQTGVPLPQIPAAVAPVTVNKATAIALGDNGVTFTVTNYGSRKTGDTDVVRTRVNRGATSLFSKDVTFSW